MRSSLIIHDDEITDNKGNFIFGTKKERAQAKKEVNLLESNEEYIKTMDDYEKSRVKK